MAETLPPDFKDPFSPDPTSHRMMKCLHCGETYEEMKVSWELRHGEWLWWCPTKDCDGAGVGFDIFDAAEID